jgi:hypothetical protein
LRHSHETRLPFTVTESAVLHYKPTQAELKDAREWFLLHKNQLECTETGYGLEFNSQAGCINGINMLSCDQGDRSINADGVGQVWTFGTWFWNRLMGSMSPAQRIEFLASLSIHYNTQLADAVIHCYQERMPDDEANNYLLQFGVHRHFEVAKSHTIFQNQETNSMKRLGYSNRDWKKPEMEAVWKKMCSLCLTTGIADRVLDITWNRLTDDLLHNEDDCISNLVRLNDAIHSHKAFHSQETLRQYCEVYGIPMDQHRILILEDYDLYI